MSGSPMFVRQTLDDLPLLLARLRGESPSAARRAAITMPPPSPRPERHDAAPPAPEPEDLEDEDDDKDEGGDDAPWEPPVARARAAQATREDRTATTRRGRPDRSGRHDPSRSISKGPAGGTAPAPGSRRAAGPGSRRTEPPSRSRRAPAPDANGSANGGADALERRIVRVLRSAAHPLSVAAIRSRLDDTVSSQQVRRVLERAADRITATDERPAAYSLR